jgi:hypothetical protein
MKGGSSTSSRSSFALRPHQPDLQCLGRLRDEAPANGEDLRNSYNIAYHAEVEQAS